MCLINPSEYKGKRERDAPLSSSKGQKRAKKTSMEVDVDEEHGQEEIGLAVNPQKERNPTLKRSLSQRKLVRSNSEVDLLNRKNQSKNDDPAAYNEDYSVIAVFSREASRNFARNYEKMVKSDPFSRVTKSSKKATNAGLEEQRKFIERQSISTVGPDIDNQMKLLFENKLVPHVISIIEGEKEKEKLSLSKSINDKDILLGYAKILHVDGVNKSNRTDKKQNMSIYVRDDMKETYSARPVTVVRKSGGEIKTVGIDYKTENGDQFRVLVVHTPNAFVGNETKDDETHDAFVSYANKVKEEESIHVTSYFGDTNFKKPRTGTSVPSTGGIMSDGTSLNPQSSGAQNETNFIQHVSLKTGDEQPFLVKQPSALNQLLIAPNNESKVAVDHPSSMGYIGHKDRIFRNSNKNPAYFE